MRYQYFYLFCLSFCFVFLSCKRGPRKKATSEENISNAVAAPAQNSLKSFKHENGERFTAKPIHTVDGDTYDILLEGNIQERVRMNGIDAPERGMPYYKKSKRFLDSLLSINDKVTLQFIKYDESNGGWGKDEKKLRVICDSYIEIDGTEFSIDYLLIKAGLAWHFKRFSSRKDFAEAEISARKKKINIWSYPKPMAPWNNRKLHRAGVSTKDSFIISEINE